MVADVPLLPPKRQSQRHGLPACLSANHEKHAMSTNLNTHVLERLSAVYSAILELSEQELTVESVELDGIKPKLIVTRNQVDAERKAGELIGAKRCGGCEVLLVARGH